MCAAEVPRDPVGLLDVSERLEVLQCVGVERLGRRNGVVEPFDPGVEVLDHPVVDHRVETGDVVALAGIEVEVEELVADFAFQCRQRMPYPGPLTFLCPRRSRRE